MVCYELESNVCLALAEGGALSFAPRRRRLLARALVFGFQAAVLVGLLALYVAAGGGGRAAWAVSNRGGGVGGGRDGGGIRGGVRGGVKGGVSTAWATGVGVGGSGAVAGLPIAAATAAAAAAAGASGADGQERQLALKVAVSEAHRARDETLAAKAETLRETEKIRRELEREKRDSAAAMQSMKHQNSHMTQMMQQWGQGLTLAQFSAQLERLVWDRGCT
jgi:hypothetical protein